MKKRSRRPSPLPLFLGGATIVVAAVSAVAAGRFGIRWLWAYLIAVNVCTFVWYGYDKAAARNGWLRVPEIVLHVLAIGGGTVAAWLGQQVFRHKTIKGSFRRTFWLIVAFQAMGIGLWVYYS